MFVSQYLQLQIRSQSPFPMLDYRCIRIFPLQSCSLAPFHFILELHETTMRAMLLPFYANSISRSLPALASNGFGVLSVPSHYVMKSRILALRRNSFSVRNKAPSFSMMAMGSDNESSTSLPTSVPVRVANELLQAGHHYLDVRTSDEFATGHVVGAVNVPFMLRVGQVITARDGILKAGMIKNPKFLEQVSAHFGKHDEIVVGCQMGKRSLMAASELVSAGFTGITDMAGGYAAWVQNGLRTE